MIAYSALSQTHASCTHNPTFSNNSCLFFFTDPMDCRFFLSVVEAGVFALELGIFLLELGVFLLEALGVFLNFSGDLGLLCGVFASLC
ncbi:hypothetical protein EON65_05210 [archaeon]|nr:MAG: hypothetical protein EON65_05210 [archaeon]